ncbi:MAG: hypothetical protein J3R72DRAFT_417278 [Linnemannia gamsii]|nr:MAG: hypothetical protein J3R72DRAFT_417278 [Linnemannia gamsii]
MSLLSDSIRRYCLSPLGETDMVVEKRIKNSTIVALHFDASDQALNNANKDVDQLIERVNNNQRIRKYHFVNINRNLTKTFRWDPVAKQSLIAYLSERGWDVVERPTEADTKIAEIYHPGDVVSSSDSGIPIYSSMSVVLRPISGGQFLVYKIDMEGEHQFHLQHQQL